MANEQDMNQATGSYSGFVTLMKWGTILSAIAALIVIMIIA
ncbi:MULTISPECIES: aa3-type cytochrome c oxidase subunit IV [unclassified Sphingobium]|nr:MULTISPECIES: aa3-type cytochrome c oxidase subunit IV [unclassified Sphingobium]MCW2411045.1 hypothetical protein [Sphingobium sp. B8D3D]